MGAKGKRAHLRDKEQLILQFVMNNPGVAREPLADKMIAEIDWGAKAPEPEVLWKKISKYRNREPNPQDQPWHIGALNDSAFKDSLTSLTSPEGLAAVVGACRFAARRDATLTIRQAKWIGRLSAVPKQVFPELDDKEILHLLIFWALQYASAEMLSEVLGEKTFVTTSLDYYLTTEYPPPPHGGYRFEEMAAHSLKAQASHDAARKQREWLKEPSNQEKVRKRKEMGAILRNPRQAKDPESGDRFESLVREDTQNL